MPSYQPMSLLVSLLRWDPATIRLAIRHECGWNPGRRARNGGSRVPPTASRSLRLLGRRRPCRTRRLENGLDRHKFDTSSKHSAAKDRSRGSGRQLASEPGAQGGRSENSPRSPSCIISHLLPAWRPRHIDPLGPPSDAVHPLFSRTTRQFCSARETSRRRRDGISLS